MRRSGEALGRDPMAIYRHATNKAAVLDGVAEVELATYDGAEELEDGLDILLTATATMTVTELIRRASQRIHHGCKDIRAMANRPTQVFEQRPRRITSVDASPTGAREGVHHDVTTDRQHRASTDILRSPTTTPTRNCRNPDHRRVLAALRPRPRRGTPGTARSNHPRAGTDPPRRLPPRRMGLRTEKNRLRWTPGPARRLPAFARAHGRNPRGRRRCEARPADHPGGGYDRYGHRAAALGLRRRRGRRPGS